MRSSKTGLAALAALALALSPGCRAAIPDARFGCSADSECPPGQSCSAGLCRSGAGGDAGVPDGGGDGCDDSLFCNGLETLAGGSCAAGTPPCGEGPCDEATDSCGEPSPVTVRVVHASYRLGRATFAVDGVGEVDLSYGEVSSSFTVPGPTDGVLEATVDVGGERIAQDFEAAPSVILVLGPQTADGDVLYVLPDDLAPNGPTPTFRYHNLMGADDAIAPHEYVAGGSTAPMPLPLGASGPVQGAAPVGGGTFVVGADIREVSGGVLLDESLAGFLSPIDRSAWVLLVGDLRRHLGDPLGPAVVALDDSPEVIRSDALTHVLNTTLSSVTVCLLQGGSRVGAFPVDSGQLFPGISFSPLYDLSLGFGVSEADACEATSSRTVMLSALEPQRRHLIAVTGSAASPEIYTLSEPAWDGMDRSGDTQLVFAHYAPVTAPSAVDLAITDGPRNVIFAGVTPGQHYATYVDRIYLQGTIEVDISFGGTSTYSVTEADTTDTLFFLYSDAGATPILRSVTAPFGRSWLAGAR